MLSIALRSFGVLVAPERASSAAHRAARLIPQRRHFAGVSGREKTNPAASAMRYTWVRVAAVGLAQKRDTTMWCSFARRAVSRMPTFFTSRAMRKPC